MLFATIGTSIVFAELPASTIPKSVLVVCTGMVQWVPAVRQDPYRGTCTFVCAGGHAGPAGYLGGFHTTPVACNRHRSWLSTHSS